VKRALVLLALSAACAEEAPQSSTPAPVVARDLRDVARANVVRLEAEVGPLAEPASEDAELVEHVTGLLEAVESASLGRVAREELASLAPASLPILARWLDDAERPAAQRSAAIEALGSADTRYSAEKLLARIEAMRTRKNDEAWVRAHCAWRLGQGTQDWIVPRMIRQMRYETDHETVIWMARALARFGNLSGLDALYVVRQKSSAQELRESANLALYELARERGFDAPEALSSAWFSSDGRLPAPTLSGARQLEIWRVVAGFAEWQLRGVDDGRFTLARENPAAAALLAEALSDENRYIRTHAAQSLERMGARGRAAGPALLAALDDPEAGIFVAEALGGVGYAPAEAELVARLEPPRSLEVRTAAARGLASLGLPSSAAALDRHTGVSAPRDLRFSAACARLRCSPADAPLALVEWLVTDYATGTGETYSSEPALRTWYAARPNADLPAWDSAPGSTPGERIRVRVELLRAALGAGR
jgi:HEAT repeat protein